MKKIYGFAFLLTLVVVAGIYIDKQSSRGGKEINSLLSSSGKNMTANVDLKNYGPAPEFSGIAKWLNSEPLTMAALRGKVVLIDFWTYSCINCIRTLPYVTKWFDTYKDRGFVVIGVHTPEFAFEKETSNVQDAIKKFGIHYPVAQDNDYATWQQYNNRYWPAEYLIDQRGNVVYTHFGEGNYDITENAIRQLLGMDAEKKELNESRLQEVQSLEMYFGTDRLKYLSPAQKPSSVPKRYSLPDSLQLNEFAFEGVWQFGRQSVKLAEGAGKIKLKFHAGKIHLVAASAKASKLRIIVDGKVQPDVTVGESELYTLFDSDDYADHVIEITVEGAGFEAFTFTFG